MLGPARIDRDVVEIARASCSLRLAGDSSEGVRRTAGVVVLPCEAIVATAARGSWASGSR